MCFAKINSSFPMAFMHFTADFNLLMDNIETASPIAVLARSLTFQFIWNGQNMVAQQQNTIFTTHTAMWYN